MNVRFPPHLPPGRPSREKQESYVEFLRQFAGDMRAVQAGLDFHMGARGWCYALEPYGLDKNDFDWLQGQINEARLRGFLKPGFILEEDGHVVKEPSDFSWGVEGWVESRYDDYRDARRTFKWSWQAYGHVSFWEDKDCFLQLLVEKSDLISLFHGLCRKYRIPHANMRGWGSMEQKAAMAIRFKEMEERGKQPILLAVGDHDPPGLCISSVLKKHFEDYRDFTGWDPENLVVERVGLNYEFIEENHLTWIDNLLTGSGKNLADPKHKCYRDNTYDVRGYIEKYGVRKCEANAIVVAPDIGRQMLLEAISKYVGGDAWDIYEAEVERRQMIAKQLIEDKLNEEGEEE